MKDDGLFQQQRDAAFDRVIALLGQKIDSLPQHLVLQPDEISENSLRSSAEKESWMLFLKGIQHLKSGAPGGQPGSMTEALSRISLRSGAFATALGVKPPQFEPMYFSVDYTTGQEAALFYCRRLAEAAEGDLSKSRQIIHQRMLTEKPAIATATLKRQMACSFNILTETYGQVCRNFKDELTKIAPPPPPRSPSQPPRHVH